MKNMQKTTNRMAMLRLVAILFLVIYSMMQKIEVLTFVCSIRLLPISFLLLSGITVLLDFFGKKRMFEPRYILLPILFIVFTAVSTLLNVKYGWYTNVMVLIYLVVEYAVLYPFEGYRETAKRDFKIISYVVTAFSFLLSIYTYLSYFLYLDYTYRLDATHVIDQGYRSVYRRCWGFYHETNWQAITAVFVIFLCLYLIFNTKKRWLKVLNILNIGYHFGVLVLTGSRSGLLALLVATGVLAWYFAFSLTKRIPANAFWQQLLRLTVGVLAVIGCYAAFIGCKTILPVLQKEARMITNQTTRVEWATAVRRLYAINDIEITFSHPTEEEITAIEQSPDSTTPPPENVQIEPIDRLDINEKEDKSNGRFHIWINGLQIWMKAPLFGTSHGNLGPFTTEHLPESDAELLNGNSLLNGYLDLLVTGGIIPTLCILSFLVLCAIRLWKYQRKDRPYRRDVGFLLAAITAACVFLLFTSDLFYYRSSFTYLFLILLGFGMYLIRQDEMEEGKNDSLFIAFTPYHILQCIRLARSLDSHAKADLYVVNLFKNANTLVERLQASGIFRHVILFEEYKVYPPVIQKLMTLLWIMFPRATMEKYAHQHVPEQCYSRVYISGYFSLMDSVKLTQSQAEFVEYEDGLRNYCYDDTEARARTGLFNLINKLFLNNRLSYDITTVYLNQKEAHTGTQFTAVLDIPKATEPKQENDILKTVFEYCENTVYREHKFVYLTQPLSETTLTKAQLETEKDILSVLDKGTVVRVHPRQSAEDYQNFFLDTANNLWELECQDKITDEHVLISAFSTALFTPKMLCDKEPTVIFTYKLYGSSLDFTNLTDMLRRMYRHPERVIVPNTLEELKVCLSQR